MLEVVGWTRYDNNNVPDFDKQYRYTELDYEDYVLAVIYGLRKYRYRYTGYVMNGHNTGIGGFVPVFNNGTKFRCTIKEWGIIMSYAYPEYYEDEWLLEIPKDATQRIPVITE